MKKIFFIILFIISSINVFAYTYTSSFDDKIGAYSWFSDPRALHYESKDKKINMTYIGYIDTLGNIKATQYNFNDNSTSDVLIRSNFQPDDHNNPVFFVLPNELVLVAYTKHSDEPTIYYRISKEKGDITTLGEEKVLLVKNNVTYPNILYFSDDPNHIYFCYRGLNWHPTLLQLSMPNEENDYTLNITTEEIQIVSSHVSAHNKLRPYIKYVSDGKNSLYIAFTSTHPDDIYPNQIYYSKIVFESFKEKNIKLKVKAANNDVISEMLPINISNYEKEESFVLDDYDNIKRGFVWQIALDDNVPVIAYVSINEEKNKHYYYYAKWNKETNSFNKTLLGVSDKSIIESQDTEKCYSGGMAIDPNNPNVVYISIPKKGKYGNFFEIKKITLNSNGDKIESSEFLTKDSKENNIRPYVIDNNNIGPKVIWLKGRYEFWTINTLYRNAYDTNVVTDYNLKKDNYNYYYSKYNDKITLHNNIKIINDDINKDTFTISMIYNFKSKNDLGGTILNLFNNKIVYNVFKNNLRPNLDIDLKGYYSENVIADPKLYFNTDPITNDNIVDIDEYIHFVITYDRNTNIIRTYINGLVDQYIKLDYDLELNGNNLIGPFKGNVYNLKIFDYCLNDKDVKILNYLDRIENPLYKYMNYDSLN